MKIVFFTGAGVSAESGIKTFRDSNGLWEEFKIEEVASIDGWKNDREKVLAFYNARRKQLLTVQPNKAHKEIANFQSENLQHKVVMITQNVDDLFERCGMEKIIHLHGELTKGQSSMCPTCTVDIGYNDIKIGDKHEDGSQLRPHIVWFGEAVPKMIDAYKAIDDCDIFVVIGTSLNVYPAADLLYQLDLKCKIIILDPNVNELVNIRPNIYKIAKTAVNGIDEVIKMLYEFTQEN